MSDIPQPDTYIYGWRDAPEHCSVLKPDGGSTATYAVVVTNGGSWYCYIESRFAGWPAVFYGGALAIPAEFTVPTKVGAVVNVEDLLKTEDD